MPSFLAIKDQSFHNTFLVSRATGKHFCGSVITHYDTFILRLQSIVGSTEGERGMRLLRKPLPWLSSGTHSETHGTDDGDCPIVLCNYHRPLSERKP